MNTNTTTLFGKEAEGETNQTFYIPKSSVAYIIKHPAGGKVNDAFDVVLLNGKVFKEHAGFADFKKWLDQ